MGRYYYDSKTTVEDCRDISITTLRKNRFLQEGMILQDTSRWSRNGEVTSSIGFEVNMIRMVIRFQYRSKDYGIHIATAPCTYDGVRNWLECFY